MIVEEIRLKDNRNQNNSSLNANSKSKGTNFNNFQVYVMVATEDGHFLKLDITSHISKLYQ